MRAAFKIFQLFSVFVRYKVVINENVRIMGHASKL